MTPTARPTRKAASRAARCAQSRPFMNTAGLGSTLPYGADSPPAGRFGVLLRKVIAACRRAGVRFSITIRVAKKVRTRSRRSRPTRGSRSSTRTQSGTTSSNVSCPGRRSPRSPTPRRGHPGRGHCAANRASHRRPQQDHSGRSGSALPGLALPRRVLRQPVRTRPSRGPASRPRHHRIGLRRADRRTPGPPTLRPIRRQQRLAHLHRDRAQPHPRRRRPGRTPVTPPPALPPSAGT